LDSFQRRLHQTNLNKTVQQDKPQIGIGVIVRKENRVLLGLRKNAHGEGTWSFPGGHLEFGEEVEGCAIREVLEETGARITIVRRGPFTNDMFKEERKHYVTLFVIADYESGVVEVREREKCQRWDWFEWKHLPQPLFLPIQNLLKTRFDPFQ
jgi:8-oxo-dGTP diphosphatase